MKPFLYMLLGALLVAAGAGAQQILVPERPPNDNSNAAASTSYVDRAISGIGAAITGLTGDVVATGPGSVTATIQPGVVTSAKMASGAAATNVGTLGGQLTGTLPNPSIAAGTVTNSNLANMPATTVKGSVAGGTPADLTGSQFFGMSYWTAPGTGALTRSLSSKLSDASVSVADFTGADSTGATSSSAAFSSAVTQCATLGVTAPGCEILVPPGNWRLNTQVQITQSNTRIRCVSDAALIVNGITNAPAIRFGDGTNTYNRNGISNCAFGQASGVTAVSGNYGFQASKQTNFYLRDVQIFNFPSALFRGYNLDTVSQSYVAGMGVQAALDVGTYINNGTDLYINSSRSDSNGTTGWLIQDSAGIYCTNCSGFNNTGVGWAISANTGHNTNFFFVNCIGDTSGSYNWQITDLTESAFYSIWGSTQSSRTVNTFADGIILAGSAVHDVIFNGGSALFNNSHGVAISNSSGMPTNIQFNGFNFGDTAHGNGQAAGGGYGLEVDAAATTVNVIGGQSIGNTTGAVNIGAGATVLIAQLQGQNTTWQAWTPSPSFANGTGVTATLTTNTARFWRLGNTITWSLDVSISAGGSIGAPAATAINFNSPTTANSSGGISGREVNVTGQGLGGAIIINTTNGVFNFAAGANMANSERFLMSGVYESQ